MKEAQWGLEGRIQPDLTVHIKSGGMDFHVFGVRCRPACFLSGLIVWCGLPHRGRERLRTLFRLLCCGAFDVLEGGTDGAEWYGVICLGNPLGLSSIQPLVDGRQLLICRDSRSRSRHEGRPATPR